MRVVMYTQGYTPVDVIDAEEDEIDAEEDEIDWLRTHPEGHISFAGPRAWPSPINPIAYSVGRLEVEHMQWADSQMRPILVLKGEEIGEALLAAYRSGYREARGLFASACSAMPRRPGPVDAAQVTWSTIVAPSRLWLDELGDRGDIVRINRSLVPAPASVWQRFHDPVEADAPRVDPAPAQAGRANITPPRRRR